MANDLLKHLWQCQHCRTVRLDIPAKRDDATIIACSNCHIPLGTWGEIKHGFAHDTGSGVYAIEGGQFLRQ